MKVDENGMKQICADCAEILRPGKAVKRVQRNPLQVARRLAQFPERP